MDAQATASREAAYPRALIAAVDPLSPADDAGFAPGCYLTSVDGHPLRDIIDWRWLSVDDVIEVGYIDLDGDEGTVLLERDEGESWGFTFEGVVFDRIKLCRNACTFCFMRQLPPHLRPSLSLRDDDFRLSFLSGTFVTLTNLTSADEERIVEQRISPLRVSLHAADAQARRVLIGRHAAHGIAALDRLLAAGIEVHTQIVLVPDVNDGAVLADTLAWAYARPGILTVGIVPLGFTRYQRAFDRSFDDPAAARAVLDLVRPFQERALAERGTPWVFAADEFYCNAYGAQVIENLPDTAHYGDFSMFEDGIGIVRSYLDEFAGACASAESGEGALDGAASSAPAQDEPNDPAGVASPASAPASLAVRAATACRAAGVRVRYVVGEAMQPFLDRLVGESPLAGVLVPLTVRNGFFGGNVDVTGLLCGCDIAAAIAAATAAVTATATAIAKAAATATVTATATALVTAATRTAVLVQAHGDKRSDNLIEGGHQLGGLLIRKLGQELLLLVGKLDQALGSILGSEDDDLAHIALGVVDAADQIGSLGLGHQAIELTEAHAQQVGHLLLLHLGLEVKELDGALDVCHALGLGLLLLGNSKATATQQAGGLLHLVHQLFVIVINGGLDNLGLLLGGNLVSSLNLGSFGLHGLDCLNLGSHGLVLGLVHDLFVLGHETPSWPSRASSPHSRGPSRTLCALNIHASRQNVH